MHTSNSSAPPSPQALAVDPNTLGQALADQLRLPLAELAEDANLLKLGLDSMHLMAWLNRFRRQGYTLTLSALYEQPTLAGWRALLHGSATAAMPACAASPLPTLRDGQPFALTPVQHAYLVGRSKEQPLGGVGCHLYQEFDGHGLSAERLEPAIHRLIERHPMLKVRLLAHGAQQWHPHSAWPGLQVHNLRALATAEREQRLLGLREQLGHRRLHVERGETFDFQLCLLPEGRHRLLVNIDLLVTDAASFNQLFEELIALLTGKPLPAVADDYDFASYLADLQRRDQGREAAARDWWLARLDDLPLAPQLPLAKEPERIDPVRISRRRGQLDALQWQAFREHAGRCGVTPTMALVTLFSAVLARWSGQQRLLMNLTLFDRQPLHPAVAGMIADFTNILPLPVACAGASFAELAQANQRSFAEAHEHSAWSGVQVLRELKKRQRHPHGAPLVFTSNLGRPLFGEADVDSIGALGWGISQTPQVWIDHLAFEHQGQVYLQWDSNLALFPDGLVDTLFDTYFAQVLALTEDVAHWTCALPELMPQAQREVRAQVNATACPLPTGLLHEAVFAQARRAPQAIALLQEQRQLTFAQLADQARRLAGALQVRGVSAGDTVAVSMGKDIGQVIAVLGILHAGATYVPVPPDQPLARRLGIYRGAGVKCVIGSASEPCDAGIDDLLHWQDAILAEPQATPVAVSAQQPAYIIYTSGSTGEPKGVVISHQSALNTCVDINRRHAITASDRVLALSALHFDLSVYDIFGVLAAGGAMVLVNEQQRRDPALWCELIERHGITLWNSVPALLDMLITYSEGFALNAPGRLRLAMLSGDWIGLDLPARYHAYRADGRFVAMGGATEAAIWSNTLTVAEVPAHWRSIPYGTPLDNQCYRVVDDLGRDCPDWVPGELWIGGVGVAQGYFNDPERSARQFVEVAGERWYRTGDLGCYWPDGTLEFLGRRDKQVKVGGYRIELGEIDAAFNRLEGVKSAITTTVGDREKALVAFVVPQGDALCSPLLGDPRTPARYHDWLAAHALDEDHASDALVADFLAQHLRLNGVALPTSVDHIIQTYGCAPQWQGLIGRWLELLATPPATPAPAQGELAEALNAHHEGLGAILRGERDARLLLEHPFWSPEHLLLQGPESDVALAQLAASITRLSQQLQRPVRLLQTDARSGLVGARLLRALPAGQLHYTALDTSPSLVAKARERFVSNPSAQALRDDDSALAELLHSADLLLINNALHRLDDPLATLQRWLKYCAPGAALCVWELARASHLALVSSDLIEQGRSTAERLRDSAHWQALLAQAGATLEQADRLGDLQRLVLRAPDRVLRPDPGKLTQALANELPSYMIPQRLHFLAALPLTANGKVDHQALAQRCKPSPATQAQPQALDGEAEHLLARLWQALLACGPLHRDSQFFQLGGDSLLATRLIGELASQGYRAQLDDLFNFPSLGAFAATLAADPHATPTALRHDPANRYQPFALSDVQQAYWVGRQPGFALGGVGAHFFVEFEVQGLDHERLNAAWQRLIARHDSLRAVVRDGQLQVLEQVPAFVPRRHRVEALHGEVAQALRERLSHQVLDPASWPLFDVQVVEADGPGSRLFVSLDNLLLDGLSMQILLAELEALYVQPALELPPIDIGFRDYQVLLASQPPSASALAYWQRRLDRLPPAPALPLLRDPASVGTPRFVRLAERLPAATWERLKARAQQHQLTPSGLLLSAFAAVLSAWSRERELTLNLTLFDRQPLHPHIDQVLGDFTSLLLLAWHPAEQWLDSAQGLQQRLWRDLGHRSHSAIRVMRELAGRQGRAAAQMPVVFTSALGFDKGRFLAQSSWLKPVWGISQTPQTWLDHQVYESEGELCLNWDAVQALFDPAVLQAMFDQYTALLRQLAEHPEAWSQALDNLVPRSRHAPSLPLPGATAPVAAPDPTALADEGLIERIRQAFHEVVGTPLRDSRQNFFDAGASSLKLVQLHIRLTQSGHPHLQVTDVFGYPNAHALALHLQPSAHAPSSLEPSRQAQRELRTARRLRRAGGEA
ncbi:amino acid adenylation domain-containing protein [Pseudomonas entomophila]|uniref:non-ribosomal peptide synthetase n=1 Tax=Pseudomonas entomophila TaxID=312306 RepID=UPI0023D83E8A|nr:non-ribosomal peptide synthetase [Pseudomonas entomophila]MDF0732207.1 amino acid adenylation domain-containing protein [Pseudomonas entomophila]